jgi:hypothetical protein
MTDDYERTTGHEITCTAGFSDQCDCPPRATIKDLDADPEPARWCCGGNAEDCALCVDPNPPYPFLCPGHPRTAANERIVGEATEVTDPEPSRDAAADALAEEWHRRNQRLEELTKGKGPEAQVAVVEHVRGELVGLRGALGMLLGGQVKDGTADFLGVLPRVARTAGGAVSGSAEESLRAQVRTALEDTQISQAAVARELGVSTKHLCQMLTGRAPLSLEWAERILALCEMRVEVVVLKGSAQ